MCVFGVSLIICYQQDSKTKHKTSIVCLSNFLHASYWFMIIINIFTSTALQASYVFKGKQPNSYSSLFILRKGRPLFESAESGIIFDLSKVRTFTPSYMEFIDKKWEFFDVFMLQFWLSFHKLKVVTNLKDSFSFIATQKLKCAIRRTANVLYYHS